MSVLRGQLVDPQMLASEPASISDKEFDNFVELDVQWRKLRGT
jgi:hypothetical protein